MCGDSIKDDVINDKDDCFDCSSAGPDCVPIVKIQDNLKRICFDNKYSFGVDPIDFKYYPKPRKNVYVKVHEANLITLK